MKTSLMQKLWDIVGIPFRYLLFDQAWLPAFGWTTLEDERMAAVLPRVNGLLLDIGAGPNTLVKMHGVQGSVGVDVHDWGGGVIVVDNTSELPFEDASFDTITFIACLNHIPYRENCVSEAYRLLKPGGTVLVTMINPILGDIGHALWWYSEDKQRDGMVEGEVGGMWPSHVTRMFHEKGFALLSHERFALYLNHLMVFKKQ